MKDSLSHFPRSILVKVFKSINAVRLGKPNSTYQFKNAKVHNKEFLKQHGGRYNGYPFRTFAGGVWMGGYSDHFPVYVILLKKA